MTKPGLDRGGSGPRADALYHDAVRVCPTTCDVSRHSGTEAVTCSATASDLTGTRPHTVKALVAMAGLRARLRLSSQEELPELPAGTSVPAPTRSLGRPPRHPCDHFSVFRIKMAARGLLLWRCVLLWQRLMPPPYPLRGALTQAVVSMVTSRVEGP